MTNSGSSTGSLPPRFCSGILDPEDLGVVREAHAQDLEPLRLEILTLIDHEGLERGAAIEHEVARLLLDLAPERRLVCAGGVERAAAGLQQLPAEAVEGVHGGAFQQGLDALGKRAG
ncbi:MAG: hypothetical protein U5K73_00010 [Halofilum sp. (in: g-proteobacteria)]|nr:hypothetical protein [Halofilum sp. (in: g-proteobacteria)]